MGAGLSDFFVRNAKAWIILLACLGISISEAVLCPRAQATLKGASGGTGLLDRQCFYSAAKANEMIASYSDSGRAAYGTTELTTDTFFPVAYTLFLSLSITWLLRRAFHKESPVQYLNLVPVGAWLFDLLENVGIVVNLSTFPRQPFLLAFLTSTFTGTK